jgi:hypothetical protein
MSEHSVLKLEPGPSDYEIAEDLRRRMVDAMQPICAIVNEARGRDLTMVFGTINDPHTGKCACGPQQVVIAKHF